ncbi:MAG: multidrug MFS transporter [Candidatus Lambdaproteobacteria bacterium RIFOXYD2_FULL_50_16]|uniref:Multidrug MFS transporter n=1 Tax=Candidatus Lambdaproteobacteria bacterium RIFOXYD2_FULL_50_16 TaxID=1817772 RepID=A0A1F6GBB4_9PROT|nr:MAG: multidrug MFS transporter [Candidatus Lambdaproteobacteria bacterium RIFOXYD2_FULL_50_16]
MLHIINKSPYCNGSFDMALRFALPGDPVLLIEDGIYAGRAKGCSAEKLANALSQHEFYALIADVEARGVKDLNEAVQVIDYDGFVELVEQHKVNTWL